MLELKKRIFRKMNPVTLRFEAKAPYEINPNRSYTAKITPMSGFKTYKNSEFKEVVAAYKDRYYNQVPLQYADGCLTLDFTFLQEDEYKISLFCDGNWFQVINVYALEEDLYALRPFKGDGHMHTFRSDGVESPAYVVAACRRIGLDFIAVTDHGHYRPSLEAIDKLKDVDLDFLIMRGEEIHPPQNWVHMLNIGGSFSVNEWFHDNKEEYEALVAKKLPEVDDSLNDHDRAQVASCLVSWEKVREAGGIAVFCHPYWETDNGFDISDDITSYMLDHPENFDALELIGGYYREQQKSNYYQASRYFNRPDCLNIPVLGLSDSHGVHTDQLFGWYYSIVFAKEQTQESLREAVKSGYSVAVEAVKDVAPRAHGDFRLVQYAHFLMEQIFPEHDRLCWEQGQLMCQHVLGMEDALKWLDGKKGLVAEYMESVKG